MKKRRNHKLLAFIILGVAASAAIAASSFSWFSTGTDLSFGTGGDVPITAGAHAAYYGGGDGSQSKPYIISTRTHLYNLAWLQYIGVYNKDGIQQKYFKVTADLNMQDLVLPPIGTDTYPFLGHFDGDNHTISYLTVSNDDPSSGNSDFGMAKPDNIPGAAIQPKIVGFFGVVGSLPTQNISYTSSIVSISNITLKNLTVKSKTSETLIGLAAGYVDGAMSGVKISGESSLQLGSSPKTYVSDTITKKLSDYALVGYSAQTQSTSGYSQDLSEYYDLPSDSSQQNDNDWGGSVDSQAINRLIYDSFKNAKDSDGFTTTSMVKWSTENVKTSYSDFKMYFSTTTEVTRRYNSTNKTYYYYYADPDYFDKPQDGKTAYALMPEKSVYYYLRENTYLPLKYTADKQNTSSDNTGYIVGSTDGLKGSPRMDSFYPSCLNNSLHDYHKYSNGKKIAYTYSACLSDTTTTYVDSDLELLTFSLADNAWYRIGDTHNANRAHETDNPNVAGFPRKTPEYLGFKKYDDSRDKLKTILEGSTKINGLQFTSGQVSNSSKITVNSNIKINGQTYSSYELPKGSIDFNLKSAGYINFFAGTYDPGNITNFSFFTLNHISRSGGTISSIKKIAKIYQNNLWDESKATNATTNPKFFYQYSDTTFSNIVDGGTTREATLNDRNTSVGVDGLVGDMAKTLECTVGNSNTVIHDVNNVMFYFEIPVNDGEYAMGMVPKPSNVSSFVGAHLIYLDIGSNGDTVKTDEIHAYSITTKTQGNVYPVGVDFAVTSVGLNGGDSMGVSIGNQKSGTIGFNVNTEGTSITVSNGTISNYAFKGTKYGNGFTVSGTSPGNPGSPPVGGTRVLTIIVKSGSTTTTATVTDALSDAAGTIDSSTYAISGQSGSATLENVLALSSALTSDVLTTLRSLTIAATLTRRSGANTFTTTYQTADCSYTNKIVAVTISPTTMPLDVLVTTDYTLKIGGSVVTTTYPLS